MGVVWKGGEWARGVDFHFAVRGVIHRLTDLVGDRLRRRLDRLKVSRLAEDTVIAL